jgi:hypothetical protein
MRKSSEKEAAKCVTPILAQDHLMNMRCPSDTRSGDEKRRKKAKENNLW